jgi:hypothetical protein
MIRGLIRGFVRIVMLASGLLGMLPGSIWRRAAGRARPTATGRPLHGAHYRFSEDTVGGRHEHSQRIEALCPDGVWRAFLWTTNAENPWLADYGRRSFYQNSDAETARWLSDKFIGPEHLPRDVGGGGEAMSEEGVRSSSYVGVWVLDPYDAEAHRGAGYPFHGEGWPNNSAPLQPNVERLEDIRLLPCYESCRSRARAARRRSELLAWAAVALAIGAVLAVGNMARSWTCTNSPNNIWPTCTTSPMNQVLAPRATDRSSVAPGNFGL